MRSSLFWQDFCQDDGLWLLSSPCLSSLKCHHFPTTFHPTVCSMCRTTLQGLGGKAHFPPVVLHCENHFLYSADFETQWRAARNESNQEAITLGAAEAAHMRPVMGAKGANTMARLASPQLLVVLWWWRRNSLCPGMSSTPQIHCCEWWQYVAGCFCTRQGKGHNWVLKPYMFWGFIMDLKEVVQRRRWPWELKCFPAFCQGFCKTMKQLDIVIVTSSVGHLLLGVFL